MAERHRRGHGEGAIYETKDGKHVTLAALEYKFWHAFCSRTDHLELLPFHLPADSGEREQAIDILQGIFKTRTRDEWIAEMADIDACVGPVYTIEEALNDPQAQARGVSTTGTVPGKSGEEATFRTLPSYPRISGVEQEQRYSAPGLGEHTDALLREAGYSDAQIEQFKAGGVV